MRDVQTDVVVLGSGAAGLSAALTAAVGGAKVTVLEATPLFGGTTAVSGGGMWLPGNTLDPDYRDSLEDARVYLRRLTLGYTPEPVIDRYLAVSGGVTDFFAANSPLTFSADIGRPDYHAPWEGSSLTSRTVFPTAYELPRLGELEPQVRRPGPGGILPIQHSEELQFLRAGNADGINELIRERLAKKVALRGGGIRRTAVRPLGHVRRVPRGDTREPPGEALRERAPQLQRHRSRVHAFRAAHVRVRQPSGVRDRRSPDPGSCRAAHDALGDGEGPRRWMGRRRDAA